MLRKHSIGWIGYICNTHVRQNGISCRFHVDFINWIKLIGYMSEHVELKRGTRQACPLSPLLFAISIEPLAEMIRVNPEIYGISDGGRSHKISLYADDVLE